MYFVVFLTEPKVNVVIPYEWIQGPAKFLWEKFVNHGLNSNQNHLCYWASENSVEYFGYPGVAVPPDFTSPRAMAFPCNEGTYTCRIVHFKGIVLVFDFPISIFIAFSEYFVFVVI